MILARAARVERESQTAAECILPHPSLAVTLCSSLCDLSSPCPHHHARLQDPAPPLMFTMARERHHSSHPLPPVLSLPSVAELLNSRPPPVDSNSPHHHHSQDPPRFAQPSISAQRSTPPVVNSVFSTANGASAADPSYPSALHHASQPSPTDTTTSTSPLDQQQYYHSYPSQLKSQFNSSHQPDPNQSHLHSHVHRQDSAVSQQRLDIARATHSSDIPTYHSHRSPNDNRQSSSPRVSNSSHSPSSAHPAGPAPYCHPLNQPPVPHPAQRGYATSPPATHPTLEGSRTHDIASPAAPVLPSVDHPHQTNTRQARYNVRFAANQTPDNMPSFPKPRQDAAPAPSSPEPQEPVSPPKEQRTPPPVDTVLQLLRPSEEKPAESSRSGHVEPSVERCAGCGATWTRPLPEMFEDAQNSSASNAPRSDMMSAIERTLSMLKSHGKKADAHYENWKWKHSHCPQSNGHAQRNRSSSPNVSDAAHARSDGPARDRNGTESTKNKRKADSSSRDDAETSSKRGRVTADSASNVARPVQPPAST